MKWLSMAKLSGRERVGLVAAVTALCVVLLDNLVARRVAAEFQRLAHETDLAEKTVGHNRRILAAERRDTVERAYAEYSDLVRKTQSTAEENAGMLRQIERMAREAGVEFVSTRPRDPRVLPYWEEFSVEIEVEGSIEGLTAFLHRLESSPDLLRVARLAVRPKSETVRSSLRANLLIDKILRS